MQFENIVDPVCQHFLFGKRENDRCLAFLQKILFLKKKNLLNLSVGWQSTRRKRDSLPGS